MMKLEQFKSKIHYNRYLYAVSFAKKINDLFDKDYIIFEGNELITHRFEFPTDDIWCCLKMDCFGVLNQSVDNDGSTTWIDMTKKEIKDYFKSFTCVHPNNIECIIK